MAESIILRQNLNKDEKYKALIPQLVALVQGETDLIANTANIIAGLKEALNFFWVGIYFVKKESGREELVLGPFQGPVACVRIGIGKGVCGTAWQKAETIIVPDVEKFPGHIACNAASKSEIVVPVIKDKNVVAVLDVDSDKLNDFDETDRIHLEKIAGILSGLI
jgi:L-methionine (R)-S-oxide reductase